MFVCLLCGASQKCNALLESPTGTGKTLCLLCATLAWRKSLGSFSTGANVKTTQSSGGNVDISPSQPEASKLPTIIYSSRTHSQIRQVIQELKRTSYRPKMVVLGSREQLCIHDQVSLLRGRTQTNACHLLCRRRGKNGKHRCNHNDLVLEYSKRNPHLGEEPIDIEDLVNIGKRFGPCPYYLSKELHKAADIVFAPYNYLINRGYRKVLNISWDNSILIFDEAHNLESLCADAASFDLPSWLLTACISEAQSCVDLCIDRRDKLNDKSRNPDDFAILKALLLKLEKRIADVPIESKELGYTKPGPYIYEFFSDLNITHKTASKLKRTIEEAGILLEEDSQQKASSTNFRLDNISDIIDIVFRDEGTAHAKYYRVHVKEVDAKAADNVKELKIIHSTLLMGAYCGLLCTCSNHLMPIFFGKASRVLSWWCFNPGIAMEVFPKLGVGSVILTSGTLSPMESFAQELKIDFPIRLENQHVITPNQIWAGVVPVGPSGRTFNSSYRTRDSIEYKQELGNAIVNLARIVPDGLLVFFPSYYLLDQCIECWKNMNNGNSTSIWERICKHKKPVIEPRQSSLFSLSIEDYISKLKDTSASGAVFFAVCRGKVSEGLDFADHAGRAVMIIGMPFATSKDPKIRLKREYLDQQSQTQGDLCKVLTGEEWYNQQASRAVNQAVGRVIRHRHDYGAIILCDERFAHPHRQSQVSRWIQPHIKCFSKFGEIVFTLTRFFRDGGSRGPTKLSLLEAENSGNFTEKSSEQCPDKFCLEKLVSPPTMSLTQKSSSKILPSVGAKEGCVPNLGEIMPANRASLAFNDCKIISYKNSRDICNDVPHGREIPSGVDEVIDLTGGAQHASRVKDIQTAPSAKKRRFISGEYDLMQRGECSDEHTLVRQNAQSGGELVHKDNGVAQRSRNVELLTQEDNRPPDSGPPADEETRGSAFLVQVKEKLSGAEYKDFVSYMKALKTKAMRMSEVLQSICRLFSGPERLPLLKRFKDYIPAKYHSLYEQYVDENN
ncbi:regulator of telomere elongation helicase 1 homolog isoform X2 [Prosopis cineraria]|uniref:regulator of telomere elongation helicase 1 homolog isoform X2 n=1 Tax=Prosopis cineraria TaxID=364024 RepID=UPI00240EEC4A|nr:regulator of telomere elongation helicase 1 homolog isoform X2 [Prosopis cineraria]